MKIGVLVVDDQDDIRLLIKTIIETANEGLFVTGSAANAREALDHLEDAKPSVIVLDEMMPELNGVELAKLIAQRDPAQMMILCSAYLDDDLRERAREAGILMCIGKDEVQQLPRALRAIAAART